MIGIQLQLEISGAALGAAHKVFHCICAALNICGRLNIGRRLNIGGRHIGGRHVGGILLHRQSPRPARGEKKPSAGEEAHTRRDRLPAPQKQPAAGGDAARENGDGPYPHCTVFER